MTATGFEVLEPQLRIRDTFRIWAHDKLRFSDTDMVGHVNNTNFSVFCETGRVAFNRQVVFGELDRATHLFLVARVAINMRGEIHFPGQVDIGTGVAAIGRSSFTLGQGLFVEDRNVGTAEGVLVLVDRATRKAMPLPEVLRQSLTQWLLPGASA